MDENIKILHTSDWHLGKSLGEFSRLEEQEDFLEELLSVCEKKEIDVLLIAGDIFDTFNPPVKAVELFFKYIKLLSNNGKRAIVIIAGNHDSPERIEAPYPLAMESGIILSGFPDSEPISFSLESGLAVLQKFPGFLELRVPGKSFPLRIILTPFANEVRLRSAYRQDEKRELQDILKLTWKEFAEKHCDENGINILVTHLFFVPKSGDVQEESDDEKSILSVGGAERITSDCIPPGLDYVALGHLHRFQIISNDPCPIVYSGSPLAYSLSEKEQDKYFIILEFDPTKKLNLEKIKIQSGKRVYRKKFPNTEKAIEWLQENPESLVEVTLITEDFLKAEEIRKIKTSHKGIISIVPEIIGNSNQMPSYKPIDLSKTVDELFIQYFENKKLIKPNEEIISLFNEIYHTDIKE